MKKRNSSDLKKKMKGRWLFALRNLAPSLNHAIDKLGDSVPCPVNGGTDGFRLFCDKEARRGASYPTSESGGGVAHYRGHFPDGISLLMWVNDWPFTKAFDELEAWLGDKPVDIGPIHKPKTKIVDDISLRRWLNRIWKEALPLTESAAYPARAYFRNRKMIDAALSAKDIRFHPCLNYKGKNRKLIGRYGAVLSLVRNNLGEPVAIYRTFITKSGFKVNLDGDNKPKKSTPAVNGSRGRQVRLFEPINGFLGVSEGLETALAVYQAKKFPVWPNNSNTNLHSFVPPKGVHTLLNFVDKDRSKAGENSALILRANLVSKGIRVIDLLPPTPILNEDKKGVDWADQLARDPSGFDLIDHYLDCIQLKQA